MQRRATLQNSLSGRLARVKIVGKGEPGSPVGEHPAATEHVDQDVEDKQGEDDTNEHGFVVLPMM
jgi:hypothetical protein